MHGSAYANLAMQSADVIVAIGARFDDRVTGSLAKFAPAAKKAAAEGNARTRTRTRTRTIAITICSTWQREQSTRGIGGIGTDTDTRGEQ